MFWQLNTLVSRADAANAELKRIRQELEIARLEQQLEREERREEMRRASLTPEQRAEEDRQKAEDQQRREAEEARAHARRVAEDQRATEAGMTALIIFACAFVSVLIVTAWWGLEHGWYEPPKSNQSTPSNIQSGNPNAQPPGTPVNNKTKPGGKPH